MRVRHLCLTTKLFERSLQLSHVRNTDLKATSVSRTIVLTPIQLHANTTNAFSGQMQMQWKVNCIWLWLFPSIWLHLPLNASQITIAIVFTPWRCVCAFEIQLPRIWPSSLVLNLPECWQNWIREDDILMNNIWYEFIQRTTPGGTRTRNPQLRLVPYPLGHRSAFSTVY